MSKWMNKKERAAYTGGKVCVFGTHGTGKSTFLGTFPRINLVDAEDGNTYYIQDNDNILNVLPTTSASEVQEALDELNDEDAMQHFDTVAIDSGTKLYENMQAAAFEIVEKRSRRQKMQGKNIDLDDLNLAVRDWGTIKRWNQQLATTYILMANQGKWSVVSAHEKEITKDIKKGNGEYEKIVIGYRPDLAKKAEHDYDIVIRTYTEKDENGEVKFFGEIYKDRTQVTKMGQIIENPSFEIWREKWESTKQFGGKKVDMSKDIEKSTHKMESEEAELEDLIEEFKKIMKALETSDQQKVQVKLKEHKITNPLKTDNLEGLRDAVEFMKAL